MITSYYGSFEAYEKRIANLLAVKWNRDYSSVVGWVKAWVALVVLRSNTILLKGIRRHYQGWDGRSPPRELIWNCSAGLERDSSVAAD